MGEFTEAAVPMQMLDEELQYLVMNSWQLPQEVLDLEEDPVKIHADLGRGHLGGTASQCFQFLHNDTLTFLGQADKVVIISEQDERLWKLQRNVRQGEKQMKRGS